MVCPLASALYSLTHRMRHNCILWLFVEPEFIRCPSIPCQQQPVGDSLSSMPVSSQDPVGWQSPLLHRRPSFGARHSGLPPYLNQWGCIGELGTRELHLLVLISLLWIQSLHSEWLPSHFPVVHSAHWGKRELAEKKEIKNLGVKVELLIAYSPPRALFSVCLSQLFSATSTIIL